MFAGTEPTTWILTLIRSEALFKSAKAEIAMYSKFDKAPRPARTLICRMSTLRMIQLQVGFVTLRDRSLV